MLEIKLPGGSRAMATDAYSITLSPDGRDTMTFRLSRQDPAALLLRERTRVYETTTRQTFQVMGVDAGQKEITYALEKDLTDWQRTLYPGYTNGSSRATVTDTVRGVLPEGWSLEVEDTEEPLIAAYITLQGPTALEVVEHSLEVYGCGARFDTAKKTLTLLWPGNRTLGNGFLVETANLREVPEYQSKSTALVTRLYAQGAEGMDFASVNDGKAYVECFDYTDEVLCGFWRDDRYTVPEHLLAAAREKLRGLSQPERSWSLQVCDLEGVSPRAYPTLELKLFDLVKLIDPTLGHVLEARITGLCLWPHYPEKNEVYVTSGTGVLGLSRRARQLLLRQDSLYEALVVTRDQVKLAEDHLENTRKAAAAAQAAADAAQDTAESIADGTYTGGAFLSEKTIYAPEIVAENLQLRSTSEEGFPSLNFYARDGSAAALSLGAAGNSMQGYRAAVTATTELVVASDSALVLQPGTAQGGSGYTGAVVEGDLTVTGDVTLSQGTLEDYVVEQGTSGIWRYRKWASGLAECWGVKKVELGTLSNWGGSFYTEQYSIGLPFPVVTGLYLAGSAGQYQCLTNPKVSASDNAVKFQLICAHSMAGHSTNVLLQAVFTWK